MLLATSKCFIMGDAKSLGDGVGAAVLVEQVGCIAAVTSQFLGPWGR